MVRRMGVVDRVGRDVVPAVVRHPSDRGTFVRHRSECHEDEFQRSAGRERTVSEEAVVADRHAVTHCGVQREGEEEVAQLDAVPPHAEHPEDEGDERNPDDQRCDDLRGAVESPNGVSGAGAIQVRW